MYKISLFQKRTGFTEEQTENLMKNPYFNAEDKACKEVPPTTPINWLASEVTLTREQKENLLKDPYFAAEHEAFVSTLKPR